MFLFSLGFFVPLLIIIFTSGIVIIKIKKETKNINHEDIKEAAIQRQYKVIRMVTVF